MNTKWQAIKLKMIELAAQGMTTKQMADILQIGQTTVKSKMKEFGLKTIHYRPQIEITKEKLIELISQRLSSYSIAKIIGASPSNIRHWIKKYDLKTNPIWAFALTGNKESIKSGFKTCTQCKISLPFPNNFYIAKSGHVHSWCKQCSNDISQEKQRQRKIELVEYKGGKCVCCGYNNYVGALDFHHIDPLKKEFNISHLRTYSLDKIKPELDKCVLVCSNCHREIHAGLIDVNKLVGSPDLETG